MVEESSKHSGLLENLTNEAKSSGPICTVTSRQPHLVQVAKEPVLLLDGVGGEAHVISEQNPYAAPALIRPWSLGLNINR